MTVPLKPRGATALPPPIALIRAADLPHAARRVARGELVRVRRGVYAPAAAWRRLKPWERYLARVHSVAMTHPWAIFSHESAAALLGLPILGDPVTVHVIDDPDATSRLTGGIRIHTRSDTRGVVDLGGIFATDRSATVVDLARSRHHVVGLMVADAALRADASLSTDQFIEENEARSTSRGRRQARWALDRSSAVPETPLESVSRAGIEWLGYAQPELQVEFVTDGTTDRVDFWWRDARVVGEADGDVKYDGAFGDAGDAVRSEKARDRRLRRSVDRIAHFGWRDVALVSPLRESLVQAGLRPIMGEDSAQLASLRALLRPVTGRTDGETAAARRDGGH